ncbi:MAG: hypothetical protein KKA07_07560 [Bacteroidetes bacterium]|nr:hypothetical protein [Bacteroidota bacterium]MBU1718918.1 hypothetical protein [Bacteroidota bacterium]
MRTFLIIGIVSLFALTACRKELDNPNWDTNILGPLIDANLGFDDIIADTLFVADADHKLSLVYNGSVYKMEIDSLASLPDTSLQYKLSLPLFINIPPGQLVYLRNEIVDFNVGDAELRYLRIKSGKIRFQIKGYLPGDVQCKYSIPSASINGAVFQVTENLSEAPAGGYSEIEADYDMSGYTFDLTGGGVTTNQLNTRIEIRTSTTEDTVQFNYGDSLRMIISYIDIVPEYARGYFGYQQFFSVPEKTGLSLFEKVVGGEASFEHLSLFITMRNGFGVDANCLITSMTGYNSRDNTTTPLSSELIGKMININSASETGNPENPVEPSEYVLVIEESAALPFISAFPDSIEYGFQMQVNPMGNISGGNDFVYYGYGMEIMLNAEIPLSLQADGFTLRDTVEFDFTNTPETAKIREGDFYLIADNGFPIDAEVQLFLINAEGEQIATLFLTNKIEHADLDQNGKAIGQKRSILHIPADRLQIADIRDARTAVVQASFSTPDAGFVTIYDSYSIRLKLTGDFTYGISNEE